MMSTIRIPECEFILRYRVCFLLLLSVLLLLLLLILDLGMVSDTLTRLKLFIRPSEWETKTAGGRCLGAKRSDQAT
jgi:hypothetical protein